MMLDTKPPTINWGFQRADIERQQGQDAVKVYMDKLTEILGWSMGCQIQERPSFAYWKVMTDCKRQLEQCTKLYDVVPQLLYPKFHHTDLWLKFFAPLSDAHLKLMWDVTPYIPKEPTAKLTTVETSSMLNNIAHLFQK